MCVGHKLTLDVLLSSAILNLSAFLRNTGSLPEPGIYILDSLLALGSLRVFTVSALGSQTGVTTPRFFFFLTFTWALEVQMEVLMHVQQAFYWLSLPSYSDQVLCSYSFSRYLVWRSFPLSVFVLLYDTSRTCNDFMLCLLAYYSISQNLIYPG